MALTYKRQHKTEHFTNIYGLEDFSIRKNKSLRSISSLVYKKGVEIKNFNFLLIKALHFKRTKRSYTWHPGKNRVFMKNFKTVNRTKGCVPHGGRKHQPSIKKETQTNQYPEKPRFCLIKTL